MRTRVATASPSTITSNVSPSTTRMTVPRTGSRHALGDCGSEARSMASTRASSKSNVRSASKQLPTAGSYAHGSPITGW
jgi:hypothetical protein